MSDDVATHGGRARRRVLSRVFADSTRPRRGRALHARSGDAPPQGTGVAGGHRRGRRCPLGASAEETTETSFPARDDVAGTCGGAGAPGRDLPTRPRERMRLSPRGSRGRRSRHVFVLTRACGDRAGEIACGADGRIRCSAPGPTGSRSDGATPGDFGRYALRGAPARRRAAQEAAARARRPFIPGDRDAARPTARGTSSPRRAEGARTRRRAPIASTGSTLAPAGATCRWSWRRPRWDGVLELRTELRRSAAAAQRCAGRRGALQQRLTAATRAARRSR